MRSRHALAKHLPQITGLRVALSWLCTDLGGLHALSAPLKT
jgi:hypothetical protein